MSFEDEDIFFESDVEAKPPQLRTEEVTTSPPPFRVVPEGQSPLPVKALDEVEVRDLYKRSLNGSPLETLLSRSYVLETLGDEIGATLQTLKELEKQGALEREVSRDMFAVSVLALQKVLEMMSEGLLTSQDLTKLAVELPKVAHKISGREVQKHLVLDPEKLEQLLQRGLESEEGRL